MADTKVPHPDESAFVSLGAMLFGRSEKGQAIVEFAMLLPVLLLLLVGIIEFSLVWNSRNTVLFASRAGSMLVAEGGSVDGNACVVLQRVDGGGVSPSAAVRSQPVSVCSCGP